LYSSILFNLIARLGQVLNVGVNSFCHNGYCYAAWFSNTSAEVLEKILASCVIGCRINISSATDPVFVHLNQKTSEKALNTCLIWEYTEITRSLRLNSWFTLSMLLEVLRRLLQTSGSWNTAVMSSKPASKISTALGAIFFQIVHKRFFSSFLGLFKIGAVVRSFSQTLTSLCVFLGTLVQNRSWKNVFGSVARMPLQTVPELPLPDLYAGSETTKSTP